MPDPTNPAPAPTCPGRFEYWTPDEVAECTDGLTTETRRELWQLLLEHGCAHDYQEPGETCSKCGVPFPEWPEPDGPGRLLLPTVWDKLSDETKANIVAAAPEEDDL